jgi:hypothetical protein
MVAVEMVAHIYVITEQSTHLLAVNALLDLPGILGPTAV